LLLKRQGIYHPLPGWIVFFAKLTIALICMAAIAMYLGGQFDWIALQAHFVFRAVCLTGILVACMSVYFVSLFAMGFRVRDFKRISK
jgi:putative peptidoglycan lipid II flippase